MKEIANSTNTYNKNLPEHFFRLISLMGDCACRYNTTQEFVDTMRWLLVKLFKHSQNFLLYRMSFFGDNKIELLLHYEKCDTPIDKKILHLFMEELPLKYDVKISSHNYEEFYPDPLYCDKRWFVGARPITEYRIIVSL